MKKLFVVLTLLLLPLMLTSCDISSKINPNKTVIKEVVVKEKPTLTNAYIVKLNDDKKDVFYVMYAEELIYDLDVEVVVVIMIDDIVVPYAEYLDKKGQGLSFGYNEVCPANYCWYLSKR